MKFHDPIVIKMTNLLKLLDLDAKNEINDLTDFKKILNKVNNSKHTTKKLKLAIEEFFKIINDPIFKEK